MKNFRLTDNQILELREAHRAKRNRNAAYKINEVIFLGTGCKLKTARKALLLDDATLKSHIKKYRSGGVSELIKTNYQDRMCHLSDSQQAELCEELENNIHLTTHSVIEYARENFGIQYTPSGMRDFLLRLGYEFKKLKLVLGTDREAQGAI